jgi:hypothetical protein
MQLRDRLGRFADVTNLDSTTFGIINIFQKKCALHAAEHKLTWLSKKKMTQKLFR